MKDCTYCKRWTKLHILDHVFIDANVNNRKGWKTYRDIIVFSTKATSKLN